MKISSENNGKTKEYYIIFYFFVSLEGCVLGMKYDKERGVCIIEGYSFSFCIGVMGSLENKDNQGIDTPKNLINNTHIKELHDVIGDFVDTYTTLSDKNDDNDLYFDANKDYQKNEKGYIQELGNRNISPELLHLKDGFQSPQMVNSMIDNLGKSQFDKTILLNFLKDDRVIRYFTKFEDYDIIANRKQFNNFSSNNKQEGGQWDIGGVDKYGDYEKLINSISKKFYDFKDKVEKETENTTQIPKEERNPINNSINNSQLPEQLSVGNVDGLKNSLDSLKSNELIQFKGVIDDLQNGLLTLEKIPQFASMMNILRSMNGLPKDQIMSVVENVITTKFADKKDTPEIQGFKEILSPVLDKQLIGKFINKVDEDLNKNEKLKGSPYDVLLKPETDLTSPEARAGILNIFNNDEFGFNKLVVDFADQTKKAQVEKIIKAYILASIPGSGDNPSEADINSATIAIDNNFMVDGSKKPAFIMTKLDGSPLGIAQKDANGDIVKDKNGKDLLSQRFTPFFGDAIHGKKLSPDQYMNPELMQQLLGKDSLKMEGVASVMKELVNINGTPRTFSEAITSLFNSPLFDQIKQAIYTLMAMLGKDEDSKENAMVQINYLTIKNDIRKRGTFKDKNGKDISYIDGLNKFEPGIKIDKDDKTKKLNYKEIFLGLSTENQKKYIEKAVSEGKESAYSFLNSLKSEQKINSSETTDQKDIPQNFVSGGEYKELALDSTKPGKVEKKGEGDNQYLIVDGQPIGLPGSIFIKGPDGKIVEKTISIAQDEATKKDTLSIAEKSIEHSNNSEQIKKIFDSKKLIYPEKNAPLDKDKADLFRYYALESSGDIKNPNPIDGLLKIDPRPEGVDKAIVDMKKDLSGLKIKDKKSIIEVFKKGKSAIDKIIQLLPEAQKKNMQDALQTWATAVDIETSTKPPSTLTKKTA